MENLCKRKCKLVQKFVISHKKILQRLSAIKKIVTSFFCDIGKFHFFCYCPYFFFTKLENSILLIALTSDLQSSPKGKILVEFEERVEDISPGQGAVFYNGEQVIGGIIV